MQYMHYDKEIVLVEVKSKCSSQEKQIWSFLMFSSAFCFY